MADTSTEGQAAPADSTSAAATPATAPNSEAVAATEKPAEASAPAAESTAQTDAAKAADTTKEGEKPNEEAAPVEYEFKVPEGVKLNEEAANELKATAKELGLTQEQAQKIADLGVKQAQGWQNQLAEQHKATTTQWQEQTTNDKEIGGDKLQENLGVAKKALDAFGSPELKQLLNQSGLGNHPEVIRMFVKAGKAISEDGRLVTGAAAQKDRAATPIENRLYPNQK